ncbi:MAG: hypothetical protein ACW98I_17665 [Candidatus Hodarchaeales archaeon]
MKKSRFIVLMLASVGFAFVVPTSSEISREKTVNSAMEWNFTFGGLANDFARSVIQTADGGFALAGWTKSFGAGDSDWWLIKTDASGQELWNHTYGGQAREECFSVIQTTDEGYILAGWTESFGAGIGDIWILKTDSNGQHIWNHTIGTSEDDFAFSMIQTSDGGYALGGGTKSYSVGEYDYWLVKTNASGHEEWNRTFGGVLWDFPAILIQTTDEGYALAGHSNSFSSGEDNDWWLVKTNASGHEEWNHTYGGNAHEWINSMLQATDDGFILAGGTRSFGVGIEDMWLVKTDSNGKMEWNHTFGGNAVDNAFSLIQTTEGGFALAGFSESYGAGGRDMWLGKTDSSGQSGWNKTFGGSEHDFSTSIIQTSTGDFVLAGYTESYGAGGQDIWLIKTSNSEPTTTSTTTTIATTTTTTTTTMVTTSESSPILTSVVVLLSLVSLLIFRKNKRKI